MMVVAKKQERTGASRRCDAAASVTELSRFFRFLISNRNVPGYPAVATGHMALSRSKIDYSTTFLVATVAQSFGLRAQYDIQSAKMPRLHPASTDLAHDL